MRGILPIEDEMGTRDTKEDNIQEIRRWWEEFHIGNRLETPLDMLVREMLE